MFHKSAAYYDLIYRELKDYGDEALKLDYLLKKLEPWPRRLLDVACGTGEHARLLSEFGYLVDGIDIEPAFVEIATRKSPRGEFTLADMRRFSLPRRYDAVLCLFSSIGYVETQQGLRDAFRCMAGCLEPGGWLVCEPWATPEKWKPGQVDVVESSDETTGAAVTRTRVGASDGRVSVITIDYDVRSPQGERHFSEEHRLGLFTREEMTQSLAEAGFAPRWAEHGFCEEGLLLARRIP